MRLADRQVRSFLAGRAGQARRVGRGWRWISARDESDHADEEARPGRTGESLRRKMIDIR